MAKTRAQLNRAVRQEALREQLSNQGHVEHVIDMVDKIRKPKHKLKDDMLARYKIAIDTKLKLINKYLPDLKATEITGPDGEALTVNLVQYLDAKHNNTK